MTKKYLTDYSGALKRELVRLKASKMDARDKKNILDYHTHCISNEISIPRILRSVSMLRIARQTIGKPFKKAKRKDWEGFFVKLKK